jgi:hypothetical protein
MVIYALSTISTNRLVWEKNLKRKGTNCSIHFAVKKVDKQEK